MPEWLKSIGNWLRGLIAAGISGAASSITASVVSPESFNIQDEKGIKNILILAGVSGIFGIATYLKQSPVPK